MGVIVAVDVGGSGLRLTAGVQGRPMPEPATAPGVRIGPDGMDVPALVASAKALLGQVVPEEGEAREVDAVVWATRGIMLLDPPSLATSVREALQASHVAVVADPVAALVGAVGGLRPGAVVAAGTGAIAFASDFDRLWTRAEGWGHLLGDRGSAAVLGLDGMRAAVRAVDGMPDASPALLARLEDVLGPARSWPRQVTGPPDAPERLAALAPVVVEVALAGDEVAAALCQRAGRDLAHALLAVADGLPSAALSAVGGLLEAAPVRDALVETVAAAGREMTPSVGGVLDGAWRLAEHLAAHQRIPSDPAYVWHG